LKVVPVHKLGRLPDGRIVCAGTTCIDSLDDESSEEEDVEDHTMAQVLEPPPHGSPSGASWQWRALPGVSVLHSYGGGCVLSDGRFAIFGGADTSCNTSTSSHPPPPRSTSSTGRCHLHRHPHLWPNTARAA
jgi:hypothetical protein